MICLGVNRGLAEDFTVLGHYAMSTGKELPTFRRNAVVTFLASRSPSSSLSLDRATLKMKTPFFFFEISIVIYQSTRSDTP